MFSKSFVFLLIVLVFETKCDKEKVFDSSDCDLGSLVEEIASYDKRVKKIIDYTLSGPFKGKTYDELAKFVDKFGARPSGTLDLEQSIDYMIDLFHNEGLHEVITEEVEVPLWERGAEVLTMYEPRKKKMEILGLGKSVKTPLNGLTAEVVVISNFTQLEETPDEKIKGKIVLYVPIFTTYSETVVYRTQGAAKASAKGAVASLVRSIAPFSIDSPHTGSQTYSDGVEPIPAAAITLEDADLITRLYNRGETVKVQLIMYSTLETRVSRNTLVDLKGKESPEKLVIVSGHIDSWDVGQGAMDDGGGIFVSWAAPVILNRLNLIPRRTIRAILWTAEELGLIGVHAYKKAHEDESHNINFIMESDEGTFAPLGLVANGNHKTRCIVAEVLKLFQSINASTLIESDSPGSDISIFTGTGIPGASLHNDNGQYFWFHHTEGDTMNVETTENLDLGAAFWTAVAYIIADLSIDIPR
ncbi:hypothetical protein PYW07_015826 [Mythimna separata]|uniref:Carboxypeptidase Q n=1 Tax=Mythimna separata TaxID=271217 RepID=A0AAD7YQT9_MYTSE|nr:hypothetical protein PYW07_015826 [Mythimna separata]